MCAALLRQHHFNSFSRSISIRKQDAFQRLINYENSLDYWILIQLTFKLQIMVSFTILLCFKNEVNDSSPGFSNVQIKSSNCSHFVILLLNFLNNIGDITTYIKKLSFKQGYYTMFLYFSKIDFLLSSSQYAFQSPIVSVCLSLSYSASGCLILSQFTSLNLIFSQYTLVGISLSHYTSVDLSLSQ